MDNFVYHHWKYTLNYHPLLYPFRFIEKCKLHVLAVEENKYNKIYVYCVCSKGKGIVQWTINIPPPNFFCVENCL